MFVEKVNRLKVNTGSVHREFYTNSRLRTDNNDVLIYFSLNLCSLGICKQQRNAVTDLGLHNLHLYLID